MFPDEVTPPQAEDGRPVGADRAEERPEGPRLVDHVFIYAVEIKNK